MMLTIIILIAVCVVVYYIFSIFFDEIKYKPNIVITADLLNEEAGNSYIEWHTKNKSRINSLSIDAFVELQKGILSEIVEKSSRGGSCNCQCKCGSGN